MVIFSNPLALISKLRSNVGSNPSPSRSAESASSDRTPRSSSRLIASTAYNTLRGNRLARCLSVSDARFANWCAVAIFSCLLASSSAACFLCSAWLAFCVSTIAFALAIEASSCAFSRWLLASAVNDSAFSRSWLAAAAEMRADSVRSAASISVFHALHFALATIAPLPRTVEAKMKIAASSRIRSHWFLRV